MPKVIILGCGRQGARLAELMEAAHWDVSIVDRQPVSFNRLEEFKGARVVGNGIDIDVLKKAGIEGSNAFAAVTNGDNTNLMTAQVAKYIFKVPLVVCRVYDPRRSSIYHDLGLSTVCGTTVGARMLRNIITAPSVLRLWQLGDGAGMAVELKTGGNTDGKKIRDLEIPGEFRISAVVRDNEVSIPDEGFILKNGDQILGSLRVGPDEQPSSALERIKMMLGIEEDAVNYPLRGGY